MYVYACVIDDVTMLSASSSVLRSVLSVGTSSDICLISLQLTGDDDDDARMYRERHGTGDANVPEC